MFYVCRVRHILNGAKANPQNPDFLQIIAPLQSRLLRGPVLPSIKTDNRQRPTPDSVFFYRFFLFAIDNGIIAFTP